MTFIWGCVLDLMLFVRQARSVIALDTSSHMSILNKLRISSHGEVAGGKVERVSCMLAILHLTSRNLVYPCPTQYNRPTYEYLI